MAKNSPRVTGEPITTITDDQLRWLRDNTGWVGDERVREHRIIRNALHGDSVARGLCIGFYNERMRNEAELAAIGPRCS